MLANSYKGASVAHLEDDLSLQRWTHFKWLLSDVLNEAAHLWLLQLLGLE